MFWVYRYKGFSFTAARTVHTALVLAGSRGAARRIPAIYCWRWCRQHRGQRRIFCAASG